MTIQQAANSKKFLNTSNCSHCNTVLPENATFCSFCGKQVQDQEHIHQEIDKKSEQNDSQEWNVDTLRLPPRRSSSRSTVINDLETYEGDTLRLPLRRSSLSSSVTPDAIVQKKSVTIPESATVIISSTNLTPSASPSTNQIESYVVSAPLPQQGMLYAFGSNDLWPIVCILSAIAAVITNFVFLHTFIRPFVILWFLSLCPGMTAVRFLHLQGTVVKLVLALALSLAIDAVVAALQLYVGWWSPDGTLSILVVLSTGAALVQLITNRYYRF